MNAGMKMLLLTNASGGRSGGRIEFPKGKYDRMGYDGVKDTYEAESRSSDHRGREHYDNVRFAPRNHRGYGEKESSYGRTHMGGEHDNGHMEMGYRPFPDSTGGGERMNQIGFRSGAEVDSNYRMEAGYQGIHETDHRASSLRMGQAGSVPMFTRETAEEWAHSMKNEDGTKGPHWTMDQVKQVMAQKSVKADPWEFYAALNAMYSDYAKVFKKYGVGDKLDFYIDMAQAFIEDQDAQPDKLARYFQFVVKH